MVTIKKQLVSSAVIAKSTSGNGNSRKYITIHETGNPSKGANAQSHANLQANGNSRQASWHWQVDNKQAIQSFAHSVRCWHAGSSAGNNSSIGIEICINSDGNYAEAINNAAELVKHIMKEENIPLANVVQHNKWSGKNCPTILRAGNKGINWSSFLNKVSGATVAAKPVTVARDYFLDGDTGAGVKALQQKLNQAGYPLTADGIFGKATETAVRAFQLANDLSVDGIAGKATLTLLDKPKPAPAVKPATKPKEDKPLAEQFKKDAKPSESLAPEFNKAVALGITDGTYPQRPATREEVAVMVLRGAILSKEK